MKKKNLVIVESPAKSKTIEKFLGKDYEIKASYGHIRDLPSYRLAVNTAKNFEPSYSIIKGKEKILKDLLLSSEKAETIYIATDPDREGEAIAWHIKESLKIPDTKLKRIVFNEITKNAVLESIDNSRPIDVNLVDAQQARRILDRLIGYKLSPILSKKIQRGLSAGRVQSVAVKMIFDREKEIQAFQSQEYWLITAMLSPEKAGAEFQAKLFAINAQNLKVEIHNQTEADEIVKTLALSTYEVSDIQKTPFSKNSPFPFITSTLQQEASKKLNWSTKKTMIVAQQLYEGVEINGESIGLITYMRTDSIRISDEAKSAVAELIVSKFGKEYLGNQDKVIKKKKGVQDAHEAIRPTYIDMVPSQLEGKLPPDQLKLYKLIWERFVASQMAPAKIETTQIIITAKSSANTYFLRTSGQKVQFDGFTKLYSETVEDKSEDEMDNVVTLKMPQLQSGDSLKFKSVEPEQKFTQPPMRYTEASLVKELEERGIGRPSTYAPIISIILERKYVEKDKKRLRPTDLGMVVTEQLAIYFSNILDVNFTAGMENQLDEIMEGKHIWQKVVGDFYEPFQKLLENANLEMKKINTDKPTDISCDKCGKPMVIKIGRFGEFIACSDYPACKNTKSLKADLNIPCPLCKKSLVEKRSKRGKIFYGCSGYPACTFAVWDKPIAETCSNCQYPILLTKKKNNVEEKFCPNCKTKFPTVS